MLMLHHYVEENQTDESEDAVVQSRTSQDEASQKKDHINEIPSDDESASTDTVEMETTCTNYLNTTAKDLDCLYKFPLSKHCFLSTPPHFPPVLQWKGCSA